MGRRNIGKRLAVHLTVLLLGTPSLHVVAAADRPLQVPSLDETVLPAQGRQQTLMRVPVFGRYAVVAESGQGTALQLIDRMSGPGSVEGNPGNRDGRLDLFLERGEYKLITQAHDQGEGEVRLTPHAFAELNEAPVRLVELKEVHTSLEDFQQRSYWIEITRRRRVVIEAAGRSLGDLRLWKDGDWLVKAEPDFTQLDPRPGQSLADYRLTADLEPGLYRLTAYGGRPRPWTEQSDASPLYIRYGIPRLDVAGRQHREVSPFGVDYWLVPHQANYFRLELPEAKSASLTLAGYDEQRPFGDAEASAQIGKQSIPPVAELAWSGNRDLTRVSVTAAAGQPYVLQQFESRENYTFSKGGDYWIGTLHAGSGGDSVDATSVLIRHSPGHGPELVAARPVLLQGQRSWQRRFNLLDELTLHLEVPRAGDYRILGEGEGVRARFRVEPFLTQRPRDYRAPPFEGSGHLWHLDAGYYVLTLQPELKGILTLRISPEGVADGAGENDGTVAASTLYRPVSLNPRDRYTLYLNRQPGVRSGVVLRELPIDLERSLPLSLRKGERIDVPVKVAEPGTVVARTDRGALIPLVVDRAPPATRQPVEAGRHRVTLTNGAGETTGYTLEFLPARLAEAAPLPPIPPQRLREIPAFPRLSGETTRFFDLPRGGQATYNLVVERAALYRLESRGLLDISGDLRTRTNPALQSRRSNGVGRNFLIQNYLREGNYQITVRAQGESRGHRGLSLRHAELMEGGRLAPGVPARFTLPEGRGLAYGIEIAKAGEYRLRVLSVGQVRRVRLEDEAGWPLLQPNTPGDLRYRFSPGRYRVIIPPNPVAGRVVSLLEAVTPPSKFSGHGPHPLALDSEVDHLWLEPREGEPRLPDQWHFELPAEANVQIALNSEMQGELFLLGEAGDAAKVAEVGALKPWRGLLRGGRYRLEVKCGRPNNQVDYRVSLKAEELLAGARRELSLPAELELSVGREALVELDSFGMSDLRARLYDAGGRLLARNDDRDHDWNFLIARKLDPGRYRLKLDPVGQAQGSSEVFMRIPAEIAEPELALPAGISLDDDALHTFPLNPPAGRSLLLVTADSADTVGMTLEVDRGTGWQWSATSAARSAHLLVPLDTTPGHRYRLRLWSIDRRGAAITLKAEALAPASQKERRGELPLQLVEQGAQRFALTELSLARPGVVSLSGDDGLIGSGVPGLGLQPLAGGRLAVSGKRLWLAVPLAPGEKIPSLEVRRLELDPGSAEGVQFTLPAGETVPLDLTASGGGPRLVVATARSGLPGLQVGGTGDASKRGTGMAIADASSAGVALGGAGRVRVWNAGDRERALEVSLSQTVFAPPRGEPAGYGVTSIDLAPAGARRFDLPEGSKRLRLALPPGTAAVCSDGERVISTHWAGDEPLSEGVDTRAGRLTLLYRGTTAAQAQLEISPVVAGSGAGLEGEALLQRSFTRNGVDRVRVVKVTGASQTLHVRGDVEAMLVQDDGRVARGPDMAMSDSGTLVLRHRPGLLLAWLETPHVESATSDRTREPSRFPATITLQGHAQQLTLQLSDAVLLHLRSDTPLIARLRYPDGTGQVDAYPQGLAADRFLPRGASRLELQGIGGAPLSGRLWLSTGKPLSMGEGEGPGILLDAGATALYRFEIERPGAVGIGVRASSDLIEAQLLNPEGRPLGRGVVQMPTLNPGSYYLAIRTPAAGPPIRIKPLLVGLRAPHSGPPQEVIRDYLEKAGLKLNVQESSR